MRKDLISLYQLQLHVKSWGNSDNEKVREFLKEVFKIGFSNYVSDIFPMDDFLYGDFLKLDREFLYKEYLEFLKSHEEIDDVLYYIAENGFEKFNSICASSVQNIEDINKIFKTKKEIDSEPKIIIEESFSMNFQEPEDNVEMHSSILSKDLYDFDLNNQEVSSEIPDFLKKQSAIDSDKEIDALKTSDLYSDIIENMNIKTNDHIKYNFYARMRINDHINDIKTLRGKLDGIFTS
ncbi:hypothetical protein N8014_03660 [Pseudomonadota bacterium]|nr:hypothetical protein [Pseudomonadota bacterium]